MDIDALVPSNTWNKTINHVFNNYTHSVLATFPKNVTLGILSFDYCGKDMGKCQLLFFLFKNWYFTLLKKELGLFTCFCCDFCISSTWARSTSNMTGANRITEELATIHVIERDRLYIDFTPDLQIRKRISIFDSFKYLNSNKHTRTSQARMTRILHSDI